MSESQGTAAVGSQVLADRYELAELLGRGGMAEVYRAHDRLLDRTVAVKIFRPRDEPGARRHSDDEAHALARLAHPGLVSIFDVGAVDDRPFLVMEFVEGTSLQARISAGPLPVDQVMRIGGMLAEALAHAHDRGVVHRDVKPSNIMLDDEDVPHLTDFGIALLAGSPRVTSESEIVGTPAYLAPEQVSGGEVGPPADVYALGLVLLECLTGEMEYSSDSSLTAALARFNRPPRIPDGLSPRLAGLLAAMTSAEVSARPTAATCALSLMAATGDLADTVIDVPLPRQATTPPVVDEPVAWWADEDRTAPVPVEPPVPVGSPSRSRLVAGSVAAVAVLVVALALLLNAQQPLTGHPQAGSHAQSGPSAGTSTHPTGSTGGRGTGHDPHSGKTLVAKEHPVHAAAPGTAAARASSNPRAAIPPPATTSPPAVVPPAATTTSPQPPTTTSPPPPSTTSASTPPPSPSAATNSGTH